MIETLNDLIETSRDGEQGFRTCAQGVTSPNLKTLFEAAARRCAEGVAELETKVRGLGGSPRTAVLQVGRCIALGST